MNLFYDCRVITKWYCCRWPVTPLRLATSDRRRLDDNFLMIVLGLRGVRSPIGTTMATARFNLDGTGLSYLRQRPIQIRTFPTGGLTGPRGRVGPEVDSIEDDVCPVPIEVGHAIVDVVDELRVSDDLVRRVGDVHRLYVDRSAISLRYCTLLGLKVVIGVKRRAVRNGRHIGPHGADPLS